MLSWGKESKAMAWWYNALSKGDEPTASSGTFGF